MIAVVRTVCGSCNGIRLVSGPQVGTLATCAGAALPQQQLARGAPGTAGSVAAEAADVAGPAAAKLRPHEVALQAAEDLERALLEGEGTGSVQGSGLLLSLKGYLASSTQKTIGAPVSSYLTGSCLVMQHVNCCVQIELPLISHEPATALAGVSLRHTLSSCASVQGLNKRLPPLRTQSAYRSSSGDSHSLQHALALTPVRCSHLAVSTASCWLPWI